MARTVHRSRRPALGIRKTMPPGGARPRTRRKGLGFRDPRVWGARVVEVEGQLPDCGGRGRLLAQLDPRARRKGPLNLRHASSVLDAGDRAFEELHLVACQRPCITQLYKSRIPDVPIFQGPPPCLSCPIRLMNPALRSQGPCWRACLVDRNATSLALAIQGPWRL